MWGIICILSTLWWSCALSQKCTTPFGKSSKCVPLHECPDLLYASRQNPLSQHMLSFLQKSKCGLGSTSKVCCGPFPDEKPNSVITKTSNPKDTHHEVVHSSENFPEDSLPAPRDQCGNENFEHRIYSGLDTGLKEFPWMALLGYKKGSGPVNYKCGGSLINHRYVLTAAHCLSGGYTNKYGSVTTVRLGEYDMSHESTVDCKDGVCADQPQEIPVVASYAHPQYEITNPNRTHDIAILRLAFRAEYTDYVQPICLGEEPVNDSDETELFVSGWGRTLKVPSSPVKLKLNLTLFNKEDCVEKFGKRGAFLGDTQLCVGGKFNEDVCQGDSGGPLMMKTLDGIWEAVGVISFGRGCGLDGWPGVYTSVAHYLGWIGTTLQMSNQ